MRALFASLGEREQDKALRYFIEDAVQKRPYLDSLCFANLLPRAIQYELYFNEHNRKYPEYAKEDWDCFFDDLLDPDNQSRPKIQEILERNRNNTTIIERYLGPKLVLKKVYPNRGIYIADFGCSLALGVRELELGNGICEVEDKTEDKITERLSKVRLNIVGGVATDREYLEDKVDWVAACSVYFNDIDRLGFLLARHAFTKRNSGIDFHQADMLDLNLVAEPNNQHARDRYQIKKGAYDASMVLTALYQLPDDDVFKALTNLRKATKPGGVVIVQDFFGLEEKSLRNRDIPSIPLESLGIEDRRSIVRYQDFYAGEPYRTLVLRLDKDQRFNRAWEVLRWNHARCESLSAGSDYAIFMEENSRNRLRKAS